MPIDRLQAQCFGFPIENASGSNKINQAIMQDLASVGGRDQFRKVIKCVHRESAAEGIILEKKDIAAGKTKTRENALEECLEVSRSRAGAPKLFPPSLFDNSMPDRAIHL